jgi:hypothetical protein
VTDALTVTLFSHVNVLAEYDDGPVFARIKITPEYARQLIQAMDAIAKIPGVLHLALAGDADWFDEMPHSGEVEQVANYGGVTTDHYAPVGNPIRVESDSVQLHPTFGGGGTGRVYWTAVIKHTDVNIETDPIERFVLEAIRDGRPVVF